MIKNIIIKYVFLLLGFGLLLNGIVLIYIANFNVGLILLILIAVIFISCGLFAERLSKVKWINLFIASMILVFTVMSLCLYLYGNNNTIQYNEDAIIVLGSGIQGEDVSPNLANRLNTVVEYHTKNPQAIIIVSGGQGKQEHISEALAMERYLIAKGVSNEQIIKEDQATSTYENFLYSLEILEESFSKDYAVAFITNDFHVFRSEKISMSIGMHTRHMGAETIWYTIPMNYLREIMAIIKFYLF